MPFPYPFQACLVSDTGTGTENNPYTDTVNCTGTGTDSGTDNYHHTDIITLSSYNSRTALGTPTVPMYASQYFAIYEINTCYFSHSWNTMESTVMVFIPYKNLNQTLTTNRTGYNFITESAHLKNGNSIILYFSKSVKSLDLTVFKISDLTLETNLH